MKIIGLTAENIKRLVAVEIEPTGASLDRHGPPTSILPLRIGSRGGS